MCDENDEFKIKSVNVNIDTLLNLYGNESNDIYWFMVLCIRLAVTDYLDIQFTKFFFR